MVRENGVSRKRRREVRVGSELLGRGEFWGRSNSLLWKRAEISRLREIMIGRKKK